MGLPEGHPYHPDMIRDRMCERVAVLTGKDPRDWPQSVGYALAISLSHEVANLYALLAPKPREVTAAGDESDPRGEDAPLP
jgi:hypothetical protein